MVWHYLHTLTWPEQEGQMMNEIGDEEEIDRMVLAYSPKFQRILRAAKQQEIYSR